MVTKVKAGTLGGELYEITFANDGLVIAYNDGFDLSADVKQIGDDAVAKFKSEG
jgi:hypothetical protein